MNLKFKYYKTQLSKQILQEISMTIKELKPMADRAKEAIKLINQIKELGILETEPSYLEIKKYLNEWIKSEDKNMKEYTIEFPRYKRKGYLTLPWRADKTCEFLLKKPYGV